MADWPYGVTLNAVISILTTLMKAAMAFPITEALSQLRWPWSSQGNKLSDLALLDAASRGAIGAALVLMRYIPRYLVTVGCFVLVVAAAIALFVQQVIAINMRPVHSRNPSSIQICNTSTYTDYGYLQLQATQQPDLHHINDGDAPHERHKRTGPPTRSKNLPIIINFTAISAAGYGVPPQVSATECALYFCIDTYEATVKDGDFNKRPVSSANFSNLSSTSVTENFALIPETCYVNSTQSKGPSQCTYPVNWLSRLALVNSLTPLLNVPGEFYMSNQVPWSSDIVHTLYGQQGNLTNITTIFNSLTSSLTTHARAQVCKATVKGMTRTVEPFVSVRWSWMIPPIALVAMSIVFLVITIIKTRNQYIWKSSPLALLFSDLAVEATHSFRTSPSLSGMGEASGKMKVWLEITPEGVKLKGIPR
ncbi:hypothetical protein ETB97_002382 [Aspergillus alliaceus]|uniref:Uncharacterized protein n=1 Tax=Petromyces alliaceus TaxID=209559 RepID=A0A8H6E6B7_PETAA|nr:hypothetical protein ETB97_002382 [Aspergillus burnettii]